MNDIVYIKAFDNYIQTSGITTVEFLASVKEYVSNVLIIKGDIIGNDYQNNFELINGYDNIINTISNTDIYGDLSFVDYDQSNNITDLSKCDIAHLLYAGHMFEPYHCVSIANMRNRLLYCSHDNGFSCKVYFEHRKDMNDCILNLIYRITKLNFYDTDIKCLFDCVSYGVLIDRNSIRNNEIVLYMYGECIDMDDIYNHTDIKKLSTKRISCE